MTDTATEGVTNDTPAEGTTPLTEGNVADAAGTPDSTATEGQGNEVTSTQDSKADEATETGSPEKYEDFTIPEGMELNTELVQAFEPIARELDLPQDKAQKLVDLWSEGQKEQAKATEDYWNGVMTDWQATAKNDDEIGGKDFDESVAMAKRALDQFGTPELLEALETTGMGNHPEVIRVLTRVGKAIGEDKVHVGNASATETKKSAEELFYGNSDMK